MPAVSEKQQKFMGLCSTPEGRKKAQGKCPPMSVAKEYAHKPKGKSLPERAKGRQLGRDKE